MRRPTATAALLALLVAPVLATMGIGTQYTNLLGTVLVWVFVALMAPEVAAVVRRHRRSLLPRAMALSAVVCLAGWTLTGQPWVTESRFWLYAGVLALVPAFAGWLSWHRRPGLRLLVAAKVLLTLLAVALVAGTLLQDARPDSLPIYRNVRHLNYDVALLLVVVAHLVQVARTRAAVLGLMGLLGVLSWFAVWSGGRAQLIALAVVVVVLVTGGAVRWARPRTWLVPAALGLGAVAVTALGGSPLLRQQVARTADGDLEAVSSGRLRLWQESLAQLDSPGAWLFGLGPDAFDRLRLGPPSVLGADQRIVQPHNATVQWLLEFGVLGTVLVVGLCAWLLVRALRTAGASDLAPERRTAAAMFLGLFAYAQLDGLFYHVVPFTLAALLAALVLFDLRLAPDPPATAQDSSSRAVSTSPAIASTNSATPSKRTMPRIRSTKETTTSTP
ncbi:O-antigen ligase family protein [Nocardioides panacisoli]|nr:O-antigen ligase family protein [Nocardioides panacisoli]